MVLLTVYELKHDYSQLSDFIRQYQFQEKKTVKIKKGFRHHLELKLWKLFRRFPIGKLFSIMMRQCSVCNRKFSEIFIDYYLDRKISCKKCKNRTKYYSAFISFVLNLIERGLKMPKNEFRRILKKNIAIKRLLISYLDGLAKFGLNIPLIPAGPVITIWSVTHRCNLRCKHCYVPPNSMRDELSFEEACSVIDHLYEAKNFVVGFSGGEALLREDIFDLIKYVSTKKMSVALASNGTLITPQVAEKLKEAGAGYIQISIDGLEEIHDHVRGKGMFKKALAGIKNCLNAGLYVSIDVVVTKLNRHQIRQLIELAKRLGVQKFELLDFVPSENACTQSDLALSPLEMEKFGAEVCEIWQKLIEDDYPLTLSFKNPTFTRILAQRFPNVNIMPLFKGIFPKDALKFFNFSNRLAKGVFEEQTPFSPFITGCESGIYVVHIKPNGNVTPCPLNPAMLGSVKTQHIQKIWQDSPVLNLYRGLDFGGHCGKCEFKTMCGGCRAKVYLKTGTYTACDPTCVLNKSCS